MRSANIIVGCMAFYVFAAIVTFGHCAAHYRCDKSMVIYDCTDQAITAAIGSAMFWPLYLSWMAWS